MLAEPIRPLTHMRDRSAPEAAPPRRFAGISRENSLSAPFTGAGARPRLPHLSSGIFVVRTRGAATAGPGGLGLTATAMCDKNRNGPQSSGMPLPRSDFEREGALGEAAARGTANAALVETTLSPSLEGPVAQWLEPAAHNGLVAGSSPAGPTKGNQGLCQLGDVLPAPPTWWRLTRCPRRNMRKVHGSDNEP